MPDENRFTANLDINAQPALNSVADAISKVSKAVNKGTKEITDAVIGQASDAADKVADKTADVLKKVGEAAGESVKKALKSSMSSADYDKLYEDSLRAVKSATEDTVALLQQQVDAAKNTAEQMKRAFEDSSSSLKDATLARKQLAKEASAEEKKAADERVKAAQIEKRESEKQRDASKRAFEDKKKELKDAEKELEDYNKRIQEIEEKRTASEKSAADEQKRINAANAAAQKESAKWWNEKLTAVDKANAAQKKAEEQEAEAFRKEVSNYEKVTAARERNEAQTEKEIAASKKLEEQKQKEYDAYLAFYELQDKLDLDYEMETVAKAQENVIRNLGIALRAVYNKLREMFQEATEYVKEYDKALTSIAIVTGKSNQKSVLGQRYEDMARELKVSASEIATAAEEFYRQGITDDTEVERRIETVTKYAKVSGLSFSESVEAITAAVNNFTEEGMRSADVADRIADVWTYLGDATATGADEIGIAMQKVAASGQAAGMTLEKLSSSIAVIEAKTRLAPESVGTALNSIMSRYMKVTATGFGKSVTTDEGDVVSINDISKALNEAGIAVYNVETGFKEFESVLDELGAKWGTLDDKTRNYIATQIAGTRGMNMFLALMNDYQQVLDLTTGALNSAGTATQKYQIWQDGLEATQSELNAVMQDLYSDVLSSDAMKQFYEMLIGLASGFDTIVKATDGWNVKLAALAGVITVIIKAINTVKGSIKELGVAKSIFGAFTSAVNGTTAGVHGLNAAMSATLVGLAVTLAASVVGALISMRKTAEETRQEFEELNETMNGRNLKVESLGTQIDSLSSSLENGTTTVEEYESARQALIDQYPSLERSLSNEGDEVEDLATKYEKLIQAAKDLAVQNNRTNFIQASEGYSAAQKAYDDLVRKNSQWVIANNVYEHYPVYGQKDFENKVSNYKDMLVTNMIAKSGSYSDFSKYLDSQNLNIPDLKILRNAIYDREYTDQIDDTLRQLETYTITRAEQISNEMAIYLPDIIASAFSADKYQNIALDIPSIVNSLIQYDWGDIKADEIQAKVGDFISDYAAAISDDADSIKTQIAEALGDETIADKFSEHIIGKVDPADIGDIITEIQAELDKAAEMPEGEAKYASLTDYLYSLMGVQVDGDGNVVVDSAAEEIDDGFDAIYERVEKMQQLKDAIETMSTGGELGNGGIKSLVEAYPELMPYLADSNELLKQATELYEQQDEQFGDLIDKYGLMVEGSEDLSKSMLKNATSESKVQNAVSKLQRGFKLTGDEIDDLVKAYPQLTDDMYKFVTGAIDAEEAINALNKAETDANGKALMETIDKTLEALKDYQEGTQDYINSMETLGNLFGGGFGDLSSFEFASKYLDDIRAAADGSAEALRRLQEAAFINITGRSDVDFSQAENGLITVKNLSEQAVAMLRQLGLFDIETVKLPQTYYTYQTSVQTRGKQKVASLNPDLPGISEGITTSVTATPHTVYGTATVLKPKGTASLRVPSSSGGSSKSSGGGGGGGGGGGSSTAATSAVQNKINELANMTDIVDKRMSIAKAYEEFYNQTGELNKAIPYMQEQIDLYNELIETYQKNRTELEPLTAAYNEQVNSIQAQINEQIALRDAYDAGSSNYKKYQTEIDSLTEQLETARTDYDALVNEVDGYALSEIEARKAIVALTDAIEEQRTQIRTLTSDMKNRISGYLDEIEQREQSMVNATISMQDEILEILRNEANKELDIEDDKLDKKKAMLEEELDALRENYDKARDLADKQAQQDELRSKQQQLAALATDPTKVKERAALEKEIAQIQQEMAWNAAEGEIEAQESAIQAQIDEYDRLIEANEKARDEIAAYNEEIIEQMYEIMSRSDTEIIKWLKEHSDAYAESTKEAQGIMVDNWQETLDAIKGKIKTNWDEVESIMSRGVSSAIALLKQTDTYLSANLEDQINQVEELSNAWQDMLDARTSLTLAEQSANQKSIVDTLPTITPSTEALGANALPGSTTTGSSSSSSETGTTSAKVIDDYYLRSSYSPSATALDVVPAGKWLTITGYHDNWYKTTYHGNTGWIYGDAFAGVDKTNLKRYKKGGEIDYTGLAFVDGSKGREEGILNAKQMNLFKRFVFGLEQISFPEPGEDKGGYGSINVEEGGIVINVASLSKDADYNEVAEKTMDAIYQKFRIRR